MTKVSASSLIMSVWWQFNQNTILMIFVAYDILCAVKISQKGDLISVRLSTTARYSLRALSDLCAYSDYDPVSVSDIATRQNIPVNYLEQLFGKLRRAGLLDRKSVV